MHTTNGSRWFRYLPALAGGLLALLLMLATGEPATAASPGIDEFSPATTTVVPEPATLIFFGAAAAAIFRRRRTQSLR